MQKTAISDLAASPGVRALNPDLFAAPPAAPDRRCGTCALFLPARGQPATILPTSGASRENTERHAPSGAR